MDTRAMTSWDTEYRTGRYDGAPRVEFVEDIVSAAASLPESPRGLYVGCGNGRNYLPLRAAGLRLTRLDISRVALEGLAQRAPESANDLFHGSVFDLPEGDPYDLVVGIQVFQHGNRATAHAHVEAALERVARGGLFCVRVNAVGTDLYPEHEVTERHADGGLTVHYLSGSKSGLDIHFFSHAELESLVPTATFRRVVGPRIHQTHRTPPAPGQWSQWEVIYERL
ncbi:class I SAM-dependent methyltransferase [Streptomyces sp. NPDC056002]|uniref:class I SAM-dependent methyltransferase n=1 Tax=Streptomyces sp. NPDC056002 TaxID=3345675 RepID=UPI0035D7B86E